MGDISSQPPRAQAVTPIKYLDPLPSFQSETDTKPR